MSAYSATITPEKLIGVWRTCGFGMSSHSTYRDGSLVAIYITEDANLYILWTSWTTGGNMTKTHHFRYRIRNNQLILTPATENRLYSIPQISVRGNRIQLDMQIRRGLSRRQQIELNRSYEAVTHSFTLARVRDTVPYGWTNRDRREMQETTEQIREEILAFAEQFGEALGLPISPLEGNYMQPTDASIFYQHIITFVIEGTTIQIAFAGMPPTPTRPQRHTFVREGEGVTYELFRRVRSENSRLALISRWNTDIPEKWIDVFVSLEEMRTK